MRVLFWPQAPVFHEGDANPSDTLLIMNWSTLNFSEQAAKPNNMLDGQQVNKPLREFRSLGESGCYAGMAQDLLDLLKP